MSEQEQPRRFSLRYREERLVLEEPDGTEREYVLREFAGQIRDQYLNTMATKIRTGQDGKPSGMKDFSGLATDLLALCLFYADGTLVPRTKIQSFPSSVQMELFKLTQDICGLTAAAKEEAKNE
jgi:hypothetical protein